MQPSRSAKSSWTVCCPPTPLAPVNETSCGGEISIPVPEPQIVSFLGTNVAQREHKIYSSISKPLHNSVGELLRRVWQASFTISAERREGEGGRRRLPSFDKCLVHRLELLPTNSLEESLPIHRGYLPSKDAVYVMEFPCVNEAVNALYLFRCRSTQRLTMEFYHDCTEKWVLLRDVAEPTSCRS